MHLKSPPAPREVATSIAAAHILLGRLGPLYNREHASAYEVFVGGSVVSFQSRGVDSGDSVGAAASGRLAARQSCIAAHELILDSIGKLRAALDALAPSPPSTMQSPDMSMTKDEMAALEAAQRKREGH